MKKIAVLFFILLSSPAVADVWIQYNATTGVETATNTQKVSDAALVAQGLAQILYTGNADPTTMMVDINRNPPAVILAPPPPPPPASETDLIFDSLVQSGQIDPATIDPAMLARINASLAVSGAKTINAR